MSLSPTNILQRLQELKLWQENHEELLKKTKNLMNTSNNSDYESIEGLSAFDSTINAQNGADWESQAISPTKPFNELLEEKLREDPGPVKNDTNKPKKPFLRKGTGLQRFRLQPGRKPTFKKREKPKTEEKITPLKAPDFAIRPKATWEKIDNEGENHIRQINEQLTSEQTQYEKALEKELLIFEALEERAENSSFCSTNSSVLQILSSTPSKLKNTKQSVLEGKRVHWGSQSEEEDDVVIESRLEKHDIEEILLRLKNLTNNKNIPTIIETSEEEKWSSTSESSITSTDLDLESTLKTEKRDIGVGTTESGRSCHICQGTLEDKIKEYEEKIQDVIKDKNKITQIRKDLEQKKEMLEREYNRMKREFEDEKANILYELENERKRLTKEKHIFQAHSKDAQSRPNKKEREEISNLKQEVADLKETLKLKESKNGMTQARLRNQIKQLEKENLNLKDEIEKITKEKAKLNAAQKIQRKSADTKILHEINKNVTKLALDKTTKVAETRNSSKTMETMERSSFEARERNSFETRERNSFETRERNSFEPKQDSLLEMAKSVEKLYESTFRSEKTETLLDDGSKSIKYPNGNLKTISPDGNHIVIKYFNGDVQETNLIEGTVKYFFHGKKIWQTTYADGFEVVEFPDGIKEKRYVDGKREIILPDDVVQTTLPDGSQETRYPDGSMVKVQANGDKILLLPNGQKEIDTKEFKRREYPDGTVKILYPDGTQETKYSNGRIRIKDGSGKLIMDTQT